VFSAGLPAILPDFVQAVSASTVTTVATTAAGAEALLACDGLEALLISTEGQLDLGDEDGDGVVEVVQHGEAPNRVQEGSQAAAGRLRGQMCKTHSPADARLK